MEWRLESSLLLPWWHRVPWICSPKIKNNKHTPEMRGSRRDKILFFCTFFFSVVTLPPPSSFPSLCKESKQNTCMFSLQSPLLSSLCFSFWKFDKTNTEIKDLAAAFYSLSSSSSSSCSDAAIACRGELTAAMAAAADSPLMCEPRRERLVPLEVVARCCRTS